MAGSTVLRAGRLAEKLQAQARSAAIRLVNLTTQELVFDNAANANSVQGAWCVKPPDRIGPMCFQDFGITGTGLHLSTRGDISYVFGAPRTVEEARTRVKIAWAVPWVGSRKLSGTCDSERLAVEVHSDGLHNLAGCIHVVDPHSLPHLEIVDALALVRHDAIGSAGADVTQHMSKYMVSKHELRVPYARVLLSHQEAGDHRSAIVGSGFGLHEARSQTRLSFIDTGNAVSSPVASVNISYRIGPELFRRAFRPNEKIQLSSAMAAGDNGDGAVFSGIGLAGSSATTLGRRMSVDASGETTGWEPAAAPLRPTPKPSNSLRVQERAFRFQRVLVSALSPIVCLAVPPDALAALQEQCHCWPLHEGLMVGPLASASASSSSAPSTNPRKSRVVDQAARFPSSETQEPMEVDFEGLLQLLHSHRQQVAQFLSAREPVRARGKPGDDAAPVFLDSAAGEAALQALGLLAAEFAEQANCHEATLDAAAEEGVKLLRSLDMLEEAAEVNSFRSAPATKHTRAGAIGR